MTRQGKERRHDQRVVPVEHQVLVFKMMDGWTEPAQILAPDIDHWITILENARKSILTEVIIETSSGNVSVEVAGDIDVRSIKCPLVLGDGIEL